MQLFTTFRTAAAYILLCAAALFCTTGSVAQTRPNFGTASTYAVFTGGGAINNTGLTHLVGDVGQDGAYAFNGFPPGTYTGTLNRNNGASALAKADLLSAWTTEASVACGTVLGVGIVDGQSFDPGVYCSGAATTTSGNITFNAHGNANAIFIVRIGGQLDANAGTHILLANNARAANIYWFVDGAVNVADNSSIKGTIFARGAISFVGTSSLDGRALVAPAGAITLSANNIAISTDSGVVVSLMVTRPASGDTIEAGMLNDTITWRGTGITPAKTLQYSLDSGHSWTTIANITTDAFQYLWQVPDTISTKAFVRITDHNGLAGTSGRFSIVSSSPVLGQIIIVQPAAGVVIDGGHQNFTITFTATNTTPQKTLEYSIDGGANWVLIGTMNSEAQQYNWASVPNVATTNALIRITDRNGVIGTSGFFTIQVKPGVGTINSVILSGLDSRRNIGNNQQLGISWTYTPEIGTSVAIEYSLDNMVTWSPIATVPVTESPNSVTWTTTVSGSYNPVFVRVTSSLGMSGIATAFSIGSHAAVTGGSALNGYSVSNYPNPANSQTSIHAILPVAANATLTIIDVLGREVGMVAQHLDAGGTDILLNTANLSAGRYVYVLEAGTVRVAGQMTIVR